MKIINVCIVLIVLIGSQLIKYRHTVCKYSLKSADIYNMFQSVHTIYKLIICSMYTIIHRHIVYT